MPIDDETQAVINTITTAGYTVTTEHRPDGPWIVKAIHRKAGERSAVTAADSLAATVQLARQLGVPLEE